MNLAWACLTSFVVAADTSVRVTSPNEDVAIELRVVEPADETQSSLSFSVSRKGQPILVDSPLGLAFASAGPFGKDVAILRTVRRNVDETYPVVAGKTSHARDHFHEATVWLREAAASGREVGVVMRAYDDGVALRYVIPEQPALATFSISDELTAFRFASDPLAYALVLKGFASAYEDLYQVHPLSELKSGDLIGLPLLLKQRDDLWIGLTEAELTDYAGLYVSPAAGETLTLKSVLAPQAGNETVKVEARAPHQSPWRVLMIGRRPADLIESNLILNLNPPCRIADTSWIHPGKVYFPWWNGYVVHGQDFEGGLNTHTLKYYIDFCAENGIEYCSLDGVRNQAWYGGEIRPKEPVDVTTARPEINLEEVLAYARTKGVRMRIWVHWQALVPQLDEALATYEQWGIEGIMVDFLNLDDQETVRRYHEIVETSARHHLTVNFHGAYKPTGIRRTWPNLLTREAVRNLEYDKFSSTPCTPEHNLTVPFTRMLAGPLDYHTGGFLNVPVDEFKTKRYGPSVMGTRCHSLAMYVVYENPLPMVCDSPSNYRGEPGRELLGRIPTTWDETRVLADDVGTFITIARRSGDKWFIGSMTASAPHNARIPLQFLDPGTYEADIYSDAADGNARHIDRARQHVSRDDVLELRLASAGGNITILTPAR